jgi:murein DD-endopeptidase MepM/ murein hydrolase activator NlpD
MGSRRPWPACRIWVPPAGLALALSFQVPVAGSSQTAPPVLTITGPTGAVSPGDVVPLEIKISGAHVALEAKAFDRRVELWPSEAGGWHGLVPIDLDTVPGTYDVVVRAGDEASVVPGRLSLTVQPKAFETRTLRVASRFTNPSAAEQARIAREADLLAKTFAGSRAERLWRGAFVRPVPGAATSSFGRLTLLNRQTRTRHRGADFRAATGTPVRAPNAGEVLLASDLYFSGTTVVLDHGLGLYSLFGHLSRADVAVGDRVSAGEVLGRTGATGRVTGPHLHWAVRLGDISVDPLTLIAASAALSTSGTPPASR